MSENLLPELERLLPPERRLAVPEYNRRMGRFTSDRPEMEDDNRNRALNSAYSRAAGFWVLPMWVVLLPGAICWSNSLKVAALILWTVAFAFFIPFTIRFLQALRFYPHLVVVRKRPTRRHPTPYD
jgi:hypothetical protein